MRLTLRTLLAYLDNILEPNDAEDLSKKIEESEYASSLVHRIHDVMRRMRLGAPALNDRNPKHDSNIVAEYLDNTLPSDEVTEFEKVCLESDVHLAEVSSCHQILTLVLGEPAEIDPLSRQRMYQVKDLETAAGPASPPALASTEVVASAITDSETDVDQEGESSAERKPRPRPTVPEYLREPRKRRPWLSMTAALVIVVCFSALLLLALGQFKPGTPLGDQLVRWGWVKEEIVAKAPKEAAATPKDKDRVEKKSESPEPTIVNPIKGPDATGVSGENVAGKEAAPPEEETAEQTAPMPGEDVAAPTTEEPVAPVEKLPQSPAEATVAPPKTELVIKSPPTTESEIKGEVKESAGPSKEEGEEKKGEAAVAALPPEPLGRLMSSQEQVLLIDDGKGDWTRVASNQMLLPHRYLSLPTYRNKVTLTVGVTLEILGGTKIELLASGPKELPGVQISYGRIVMMPLAQPGSRLRVAFGDRVGVITFPDAESVAALEVRRLYLPGTNPESGPPHIMADLYASSGTILWDEIGGKEDEKTVRLSARDRVGFNAGLTTEPAGVKEMPKWIAAEPISHLDRRASAAIAQSLPTDRLARLALMELAMSRPQKEVRWLALRCLGYLEQYDDMVAALNDPAYKLDWPEYIDKLREGIARNAESAAAIRVALEKQYPQLAAHLYRMLWGYSEDDLRSGADADLVKTLDDENLVVRVLGFWNLKELTGLGLFYRPELPLAKRLQPIRRWKERLDAGQIRLVTPEEKVNIKEPEGGTPPASPEGGE